MRLSTASKVYGGGGVVGPPAVWPLIDLELRGKDERVALNERKPMIPNFLSTRP